ncbi:ATP-dependent RNA helicase SUB2-like [Nymphaea colorata]|nr:ATP-dependent RNA helicase SUB2-like [Nymphaea colorata]
MVPMAKCDKVLDSDMQDIIRQLMNRTPFRKQVMMFSATLSEKRQLDYKKWMVNPKIILVDEGKLVLHGLTQFYLRVPEEQKFERLILLLDTLAFNQVIIFTNRVDREERIKNYDLFKSNSSRLLVATDLFGRGIDIERVNLVINYDFPPDRDTYLHRVGRAGRFNTRGLAINFLRGEGGDDEAVLKDVQNGFQVKIEELPNEIDPMKFM